MKSKYSNQYIINTGIGLQDVDHLKNSSYFNEESSRYIRGDISLDEFEHLITTYYKSKPAVEDRSEEADKISIRIGKLISEDSFTFTVGHVKSIHKYLFNGIIQDAGQLRKYNITKEEWVLDGASVIYGDYRELDGTLQYDFSIEKQFDYSNISMDDIINHLAVFISNLWQIHAFEEGNTRTTAVFFIQYLRSLGFDVTNDAFSRHAWYFRNALVRANYNNLPKGISEDKSYLMLFLRNLLLNEKNKLNNRDLHIRCKEYDELDLRSVRLLQIFKENPAITLNDASEKMGVSLRTVKSIVATLKSKGKIERVGGNKYGKWECR